MVAKKRKYVARKYTEYILKSYVQGEDSEWKYETNVETVRTYREALARLRDFRKGIGLPSDFAWHLEREALDASQPTNDTPKEQERRMRGVK